VYPGPADRERFADRANPPDRYPYTSSIGVYGGDWVDETTEPTPKIKREAALLAAGRRRRLTSDEHCSNDKLREMGYEFRYPTVRAGYHEAIGTGATGPD